MKQSLSALLDGEQSISELDKVCCAVRQAHVRSEFADYLTIGAVLRGETQLTFDVSAKVMAALENEPTVFAPRPITMTKAHTAGRSSQFSGRGFSALAATLAGVMFVAWVALTQSPNQPAGQLDAASVAVPKSVQVAEAPQVKLQDHLQDYVVAHQAHSSSIPLMGGTRNVRAVSATQNGR